MTDWFQSDFRAIVDGGTITWLSLAGATLVSEDLACIAAGLLVAKGAMAFTPATLACFVGILAGDLLLVLLGRTAGCSALAAAPLKWWVTPGSIERAEYWFAQRGGRLVLVSRFMPGMRLPTYLAAGVLKAPLVRFLGWFILACGIWTPLLVGTAAIAGERVLHAIESWTSAVSAILVGGLLTWAGWRLVVALATWRGRRLLLSRWRRLTRWEFWPMWVVYPPVFLYGVWLGVKHRGFTVFTAANPGIGAGGGLKGESKSEILRGLAGAGDRVARWTAIEPDESVEKRVGEVVGFMRDHALSFPVVLKPDVGERGAGVVIAHNLLQVEATCRSETGSLIAQEYVSGVEFGVFYYRRPSWQAGRVLAVTDKRMPTVVGDGRRSLEELILADDRAVCAASLFLKRFASQLDEVPEKGQSVRLTELGTHCRGALFLDGTHLLTPDLEHQIDVTSRSMSGFYFGRYDVRAASSEAFQKGNFKVIELNGLTSEATSIYDPRHSVWHGWRMLCRQWRIAFEIGAENRARGVRPLTWREILQLVAGSHC